MKLFTKLKSYGIAIAGGAIAVLLIAVRVLTSQNSKLRRKAESADARIKHAKKVMQADSEADEQADTHLSDVAREVEENGHTDELSDPNNWEWENRG